MSIEYKVKWTFKRLRKSSYETPWDDTIIGDIPLSLTFPSLEKANTFLSQFQNWLNSQPKRDREECMDPRIQGHDVAFGMGFEGYVKSISPTIFKVTTTEEEI